ncbi:MAG: hypothetical protein S4CHLAM20_01690 [Chlamydiia bacterium]|nr:hypothetical protein [Chlamydiia bacterium]
MNLSGIPSITSTETSSHLAMKRSHEAQLDDVRSDGSDLSENETSVPTSILQFFVENVRNWADGNLKPQESKEDMVIALGPNFTLRLARKIWETKYFSTIEDSNQGLARFVQGITTVVLIILQTLETILFIPLGLIVISIAEVCHAIKFKATDELPGKFLCIGTLTSGFFMYFELVAQIMFDRNKSDELM